MQKSNIEYTLPFSLDRQSLDLIDKRIHEFQELHTQDTENWFSELCFCILTANSQAQKAIDIQQEIGRSGFILYTQEQIKDVIYKHRHRFHNVKSRYIVAARDFVNIKETITSLVQDKGIEHARNFLVKSVKGIGFKEASHFLRNVGYSDIAIIDRHIIKFLVKHEYIESTPKVITPSVYKKLEDTLKLFSIPLNKLDLMIWLYMTGKVLK